MGARRFFVEQGLINKLVADTMRQDILLKEVDGLVPASTVNLSRKKHVCIDFFPELGRSGELYSANR